MARTDPQINIRVPAELKKELELLAIENSRSLNAEVVTRLEQSLSQTETSVLELQTLQSLIQEQYTNLQKQYEQLSEQNAKQVALLNDMKGFQDWKKEKKPT